MSGRVTSRWWIYVAIFTAAGFIVSIIPKIGVENTLSVPFIMAQLILFSGWVFLPLSLGLDTWGINRADAQWNPNPILYIIIGLLHPVTNIVLVSPHRIVPLICGGYLIYRYRQVGFK